MTGIQKAVAAYLEQETGIRTVCDRTRAAGVYPLLAVAVEQKKALLVAGGKLVEHTFQVTVTAASDRERQNTSALLTELTAHLLRGVPLWGRNGKYRILHPLDIRTRGEELLFTLEVCAVLPDPSGEEADSAQPMADLHLSL